MDKNIQNKSSKGEYLQILLEPVGSLSHSTVLTLHEEKLKQLGLKDHVVAGVTWTHDGFPISYGTFNGDQTNLILNRIDTILKAAIVNADQRKAVQVLIDDAVRNRQIEMADWVHRRTNEVCNYAECARGDDGLVIQTKDY